MYRDKFCEEGEVRKRENRKEKAKKGEAKLYGVESGFSNQVI